MKNKMVMKKIKAGGAVGQSADATPVEQSMEEVETPREVQQQIGTNQDSLNLPGGWKAQGKWAIIVIGILFIAYLLWEFFTTAH
jgi:hypothetical protein